MFYSIFTLSVIAVTFLLTVILSHFLIPVLASRKMGQRILEIGPRWHKNKEGTPTMGGLAFIIASVVAGAAGCAVLFFHGDTEHLPGLILTLALAVAGGMIGIIDDLAKLRKKQNEGLSAAQKFLLQLLCAGIYLFGMAWFHQITTDLYIPYFAVTWHLGPFYYAVALVLICGVMNAVNLTDGIDGLASSTVLVVGVFYGAAALLQGAEHVVPGAAAIAALTVGATAGFLVYNFYPARVFMGDTGSLFLGSLVVGGAFLLGNPLIVIVCGMVFIFEDISVILQVGYFKLTHGKRLFKMAPFHHHLEKSGWGEIRIVLTLSLITACLCAAAWFGL